MDFIGTLKIFQELESLGGPVLEQLFDVVFEGEDLEDQNPIALEMIAGCLSDCASLARGHGDMELADEMDQESTFIKDHLDSIERG